MIGIRTNLGLTGTHIGVRLHVVIERIEPTRGRRDIAVEQHRIAIIGGRYGPVVTLGKPIVTVKLHHNDVGKRPLKQLERTVVTAVVGHDHIGNCVIGGRNHLRKILGEHLLAVPVKYYYSYGLFHQSQCSSVEGYCTGYFHRLWVHSHIDGLRSIVC